MSDLDKLESYFAMVNFDNQMMYAAAGGGTILGIATSINFICYGRLTGASGIVDNVFIGPSKPTLEQKQNVDWQKAFLIGLFHMGYGYITYLTPASYTLEMRQLPVSFILLAGLLVGFGSRLGNGCTSGHGICGLARLSLRGIVSVLVFLTTAIITTTTIHNTIDFTALTTREQGWYDNFITMMEIDASKISLSNLLLVDNGSNGSNGTGRGGEVSWWCHNDHLGLALVALTMLQLLRMVVQVITHRDSTTTSTDRGTKAKGADHGIFGKSREIIICYCCGALFGYGLHLSQMSTNTVVLSFLLNEWDGWNPSLLFVLGCSVIMFGGVYHGMYVINSITPVFRAKYSLPSSRTLTLPPGKQPPASNVKDDKERENEMNRYGSSGYHGIGRHLSPHSPCWS